MITYKRIKGVYNVYTIYKNTKIQQDVSEINTLAKHAPIALTLLDRFHWQPQKHSRIKEGDFFPKWDTQPLLDSHHNKQKQQDIQCLT
jgi:hypothetical protein